MSEEYLTVPYLSSVSSKVKEVFFSYEHPHSIYFKYSLTDESNEMQLAIRANSRTRLEEQLVDGNAENLKPAYSGMLPISLPLYRNLISLCNTNVIPSHYHSFYNLVPSENSTLVTNDSDEED